MTAKARECLPVNKVLEAILNIEKDVTRFYGAALERTKDDEAQRLFTELRADMKSGTESFEKVCKDVACGQASLRDVKADDLYFLNALVQSGFYKQTGRPEELAAPGAKTSQLVGSGLQLERDLLLFYMKFHGVCCTAHRPILSELIQRGQRHISGLNNLYVRLGLR